MTTNGVLGTQNAPRRRTAFPTELALLQIAVLMLASCDVFGPREDPRLDEVEYAAVSAGEFFSCGLSRDGDAFCWGGNRSAQLGGGSDVPLTNAFHPVPIASNEQFVSIAAGGAHACALDVTGAPYCWGSNRFSELGLAKDESPNSCRDLPCAAQPTRVPGELRFDALASGQGYTCGLTQHGEVYCWGRNSVGQLGIGTFGGPVPAPTRVQSGDGVRFVALTAGGSHTCALSDDAGTYCWGGNDSGQIGAETEIICGDFPQFACSPTPVRSATGLDFHTVAAGRGHVCGLTDDGVAHCWGSNTAGALGVPPDSTVERCGARTEPWNCSTRPVRVSGDLAFASLSPGGAHTCGLTSAGEAYCWGWNGVGTLGDCTVRGSDPEPVPVCGGHRFLQLDGSMQHHCGVSTEGTAYCWGSNDQGTLGSSSLTAFGPVAVVRPRPVQ